MSNGLEMVGSLVVTVVAFFLVAALSTLVGCFIGWVVGWVFPETFALALVKFGLTDFATWQIGAILGFVSAFFKPNIVAGKKT